MSNYNGYGSMNPTGVAPNNFNFGANNLSPMMPQGQPTNGMFQMPNFGSETVNRATQADFNIPGGNGSMPSVPGGGMPGNDTGPNWGVMDRLFGAENQDGSKIGGAAMPALQMGTGLLQGYLGLKQLGLAEDQFDESKKQFGLNYDAQRTTTNSQLRDRQKARVASNAGAYESVDSYMKDNQIKGR